MVDGEARLGEDLLDLAGDEPLELSAGVEVRDRAAARAHHVVVMVVRERLGQFVPIGAPGSRHPRHDPAVDQFGQVPVGGARRHPRLPHDLLDTQRAAGRLERSEDGPPVRREAHLEGGHRPHGSSGEGSTRRRTFTHDLNHNGNASHSNENASHSQYPALMTPRPGRRPRRLTTGLRTTGRRTAGRRTAGLLATAFLATGLAACSDSASDDGPLLVAAGFAPLEDVVRGVTAGTDVVVVPLVPHGEEAHEYEPTAKQLDELASARAVFLLAGFQPAVDDAATTLDGEVIDLFAGLARIESADGVTDPHVWLDPTNMAAMAGTVAESLARIDPSRASTWRANAADYAESMATLDAEMAAGLADCATDLLVTGHDAFGYLAAAYGLRNLPIAGISPSEEPSAATLESLAELARSEGVTTIFFEEGLPGDLSATLADEVGAAAAQLDPFEALSGEQIAAGEDYTSVMRANLEALRAGLRCT